MSRASKTSKANGAYLRRRERKLYRRLKDAILPPAQMARALIKAKRYQQQANEEIFLA
ncbi:hypothetical protein IC617_08030 [Neiella sp. HB171785]|uniref:Uncharacterized protein n=1 Tax=Neiella litorisoli TaxID=2771431 RepID=A0A8J6UFZ5_9GAMM|nr:hypothetical protein [Neiella litorisoli]MBD1389371.1 hypothetical protein [Neiella litorisoli]